MSQHDLPFLPLPGEKPSTIYHPESRQKKRKPYLPRFWRLLTALLLAAGVGFFFWNRSAITVTLIQNDLPRTIQSHQEDIASLLHALGMDSEPSTQVTPGRDTPLTEGLTIRITTARPVLFHLGDEVTLITAQPSELHAALEERASMEPNHQIVIRRSISSSLMPGAFIREAALIEKTHIVMNEGDRRISFDSAAISLGEALTHAGYVLYQADEITPPLWTPLTGGTLEVTLRRAVPVMLYIGDEQHPLRSRAATVKELLEEKGLALSGLDTIIPGPETPLEAEMSIKLTRITEESLSETTSVPYETLYIADPLLEIDQLRQIQAGEDGLLERRYTVRLADGREVSRVLSGEWLLREPRNEIIAYGTRIVLRSLETPDGQIEYWRVLRVLATSYCPLTAGHKQPGDPGFGLAAGGVPVTRGIVAVDPRVINLYQYMYIPGYGMGRALDTGGAVKGLRIDLGYTDADYYERYEWITIYLITPVPPVSEINWVLPIQEPE